MSVSRVPATTAGRSTRAAWSGNWLLDRLVGEPLKAAIDRRVAREVDRQRQGWIAEWQAQVADEVGQQLAAQRPAKKQTSAEFTLNLLLGAGGRYDRTLSPAGWKSLQAEIAALSGDPTARLRMIQAFRTLVDYEARGLGRIAGGPYNIVGKLTVPVLLRPPDGPILEIGTLFGLFSAALVKQFRQTGQFRALTVIDPLAGHQIQPGQTFGSDPTGTPVVPAVVRHNFTVGGLAGDDVRLIQGLSTDVDVREQAAEQQYAVVVVDGDHSEEGVYADLQWVETVVAPGGIVVIDDFGDPLWPGVERAVRRYLADGGRLRLLGPAATSAYLVSPEH